jgi:hypothetical protein
MKLHFIATLLLVLTCRNVTFSQEPPAPQETKSTGCISGDCENGDGIKVLDDGTRYEGHWKNGQMIAYGSATWRSGASYNGYWQRMIFVGNGTYIDANGAKYEGNWKYGKRSGDGVQYRANGTVEFDGYWEDDKPIKERVPVAKNTTAGNDGCISGDCQNGYGIKMEGTCKYEGIFKDGKVDINHHKRTCSDGEVYDGDWAIFGMFFEGEGTYTSSEGAKYTGHWKRSKRDGKGIQRSPDGSVKFDGMWKDDKPVSGPGTRPASSGTNIDNSKNPDAGSKSRLMESLGTSIIDDDFEFSSGLNQIINAFPGNFSTLYGPVKTNDTHQDYFVSTIKLTWSSGENYIFRDKKDQYYVPLLYGTRDETFSKYNEIAAKINKVQFDCCQMSSEERISEEGLKLTIWRANSVKEGRNESLKKVVLVLVILNQQVEKNMLRLTLVVESEDGI